MSKKQNDFSNLNGILGGLGDLVGKITELAEKAEEMKDSQEFTSKIGGQEVKGVYGFNFKFGIADDATKEPKIKVEPFGNVKTDKAKGVRVEEIREPMIDLYEEDDHVLVLAEMPGVAATDVKVEINDDILELKATTGERKYRKEILLPFPCQAAAKVKSNNGIIEIRCDKAQS